MPSVLYVSFLHFTASVRGDIFMHIYHPKQLVDLRFDPALLQMPELTRHRGLIAGPRKGSETVASSGSQIGFGR